MIPTTLRSALLALLLVPAMAIAAHADGGSLTDCVGRYLDYDRFRSELRYPVAAYHDGRQGDIKLDISVDSLGRIASVAAGGDNELIAGIRAALLWGSEEAAPTATRASFVGDRSLTIRFILKDTSVLPRSSTELIVQPVQGRPAPGTGRPDPDELIPFAHQPVFSNAELQRHITYPEQARRRGIEGAAVIMAFIGTGGKVEEMVVEASDHPSFTAAVKDAIDATKFIPATGNDGKPVGIWVTIPIHFNLE